MPRNGSGTFVPVSNSWSPATGGTTISSSDWAAQLSDYASAWTTSICSDGQTPCSALIPFAYGLSFPGGGKIDASGLLGIGMAPINVVDITQTQNNTSIVKILNGSAGAAAQSFFQVSNGTAIGYFYINGTGFTPANIDRVSGTVLKGGGAGGLTLTTSTAQPIYFAVNNVQVGSFDASGNLVPLNLLDISGASAGQIKFPASQNASSNANTLDDYEEGTWTPVLGGGTVAGTQTYSDQYGRYTKIGRLVTIECRVIMTAKDAATAGVLSVAGFPFNANSDSSGMGGLGMGFFGNIDLSAGNTQLTLQPTSGGASALLIQCGDNIALTQLTAAALGAATQLAFGGSYSV